MQRPTPAKAPSYLQLKSGAVDLLKRTRLHSQEPLIRNYRDISDFNRSKKATDKEFNSLIVNGTWNLVPCSPKAIIVKDRSVYAIKDENPPHARHDLSRNTTLKYGMDCEETYAPTGDHPSSVSCQCNAVV